MSDALSHCNGFFKEPHRSTVQSFVQGIADQFPRGITSVWCFLHVMKHFCKDSLHLICPSTVDKRSQHASEIADMERLSHDLAAQLALFGLPAVSLPPPSPPVDLEPIFAD